MSVLKSAAAVVMLAFPSSDYAQSNDGWDVTRTEDAITAFAEYSSGQTLAVRCKADTLDVFVLGLALPADLQNKVVHGYHYKILDPASDDVISVAGLSDTPISTAFAHHPGRTARYFARSENLKIADYGEGSPVVLSLPTDPTGVNDVLTACDRPLTDPRDSLPRHSIGGSGMMSVVGKAGMASVMNLPNGSTATVTTCVLDARLRLRDCQTELQSYSFEATPANLRRLKRFNRTYNRELNGQPLGTADILPGPAAAGDLVYLTTHQNVS